MSRVSQEEMDLVVRTNALFDREIQRQAQEHPRIYRNICFYSGAQWVWWNKRCNQIEELPREKDYSVRITENHTRGLVGRVISMLMRDNPKWQAIPLTSDEADRLAARTWKHFLDYEIDRMRVMNLLRNKALLWAMLAGRGWLEFGWDPDGGETRELRIHRQPEEPAGEGGEGLDQGGIADLLPPEMQEEIQAMIPTGDLYCEAPSALNIFVDPSAEEWERTRWIGKVTFHHVQEVEDFAGLKPGTLRADVTSGVHHQYSVRVLEGMQETGRSSLYAMGDGGGTPTGQTSDGKYIRAMGLYDGDDVENMIAVKRLWVRPSREAPNGRYVIVAGDRCLNNKSLGKAKFDNPYRTLPFVPFYCYQQPGSQFCQSLVDDLYPGQVRINRLLSNDTAIHNMHRSPQWLVHENSLVDKRAFNDNPSQLIPYRGPSNVLPPKRLDPPNLVFDLRSRYELCISGLEKIASVEEASRGVNPSGGRSAAVVNALSAKSEEGHAILKSNYLDSLTECGRLVAKIAKRFINEDRIIPFIGNGGKTSAMLFKQAQIERCFDVRLTTDVGLPETLLGRTQLILQLTQANFLNLADPREKDIALKLLDSADIEGFFDMDESAERYRVHLENMVLLQGGDVEVKSYDLTRTHIEGHTKFMRSNTAQEAFAKDPEAEKRLQAHVDWHVAVRSGSQVEANPNGVSLGSLPSAEATASSPAPGTDSAGGAIPGGGEPMGTAPGPLG